MKYTPMIEQYLKVKNKHKDMFLFYRLGDFYELFFEDAVEASKILEITLTGREAGASQKIPMCGVPFHSAANYIEILVNKGHKVAICEQVSEAGKGKLVERKVVQIITPGTYMNYKNYDENNYIGCVYYDKKYYLSFCDIMTGDSKCVILNCKEELYDEIYKNNIKEILKIKQENFEIENIYVTEIDLDTDTDFEKTNEILDFNLKISCNHLLNYIQKTQNKDISSLKSFSEYLKNKYMYIPNYSIKNLEIIQNMSNNTKKGSLLDIVDKTKTASGSRKIKNWLENPLIEIKDIKYRQNIITAFLNSYFERIEIQNLLKEVYDIERIASKVSYNIVTPKELLNLRNTLKIIPKIKEKLSKINNEDINKINNNIDILFELSDLLEKSIDDNASQTLKDGNIIKLGFNDLLDKYKNAQNNGNQMILQIEQREKEKTGIKNLKINYNKVFGYFIEITKSNLKTLDVEKLGYHRKQTLANCERFVSEELKKVEDYIYNSNSKIEELETQIFQDIKNEIKQYNYRIQQLADRLSDLDVYISFASVAEEYNYVKPDFNDNDIVEIIDGRHPIVERMVSVNSYISNDCLINKEDNILLITGPNMSGKSTYMRQLALIVVLAQVGSYVPCKKALLPIFDKIFTRIGASDDLAGGKSTFMVEMIEARNALVDSTKNSLLIFDEIGRGTSTYDGIALAQSILHYINSNIKCKTLFSTHYHELTRLEKEQIGVKNIHVSAKEEDGKLTFLYRIKNGAIEKSYGIQVAKLAELPNKIINKANEILINLEKNSNKEKLDNDSKIKEFENISFNLDFNDKYKHIEEKLNDIDLMNTTPLQAFSLLSDLKNKLKE